MTAKVIRYTYALGRVDICAEYPKNSYIPPAYRTDPITYILLKNTLAIWRNKCYNKINMYFTALQRIIGRK